MPTIWGRLDRIEEDRQGIRWLQLRVSLPRGEARRSVSVSVPAPWWGSRPSLLEGLHALTSLLFTPVKSWRSAIMTGTTVSWRPT